MKTYLKSLVLLIFCSMGYCFANEWNQKKTRFHKKWLQQTYALYQKHYSQNKVLSYTRHVLSFVGCNAFVYISIKRLLNDKDRTIGALATILGALGSSAMLYDLYYTVIK